MKRLFLITILSVFTANAQQELLISKAEVLDRVSKNNISLKISEEDFNQAKAEYRQTNAVFLPNITASYTAISTTNPLMAFGSKLNQEILTQADFNPTLLNNPSQVKNFATKLEIQQLLLNLDGLYQRKAARSKMEAVQLKSQRTNDYLLLEVEKAYMQLQLAYKAVTVYQKALQAATENKKIAENSFKQGYLQRADILNIEVRITDILNQLQNAKSNILNASNYLSFLMNDEAFVVYIPSDELLISEITLESETVSKNRSDIKAMALTTNAFEAMNKADNMTFLPRLNAFGSYELYDNEFMQADANGYIVGAQLSWDIFQGSKRFGKTQKSRAELEKSKLEYQQYIQQSTIEFNKTKRAFLDTENKLKLTRLALQQAEEALRIRQNRYKEGLEKTADLLVTETQYAQKELEYYQTVFEYNYTQAYLQFLTKQ